MFVHINYFICAALLPIMLRNDNAPNLLKSKLVDRDLCFIIVLFCYCMAMPSPDLHIELYTDTWHIFGPAIEYIAIHSVLTENA